MNLTVEEHRIAGGAPGIELYLRRKYVASAPGKPVLYVHGSTYPSETTFDLALDGLSFMDNLACSGLDVWLVDVRGFGRSTRPACPRTADAVDDVAAAVDYIRALRRAPALHLIGWSWGTVIMASYAAAHPRAVDRLVLYAPLWFGPNARPFSLTATGDYRTVDAEGARGRWLRGVPEAARAALLPDAWFDAFRQATFGGGASTLTVPNGMFADIDELWSRGVSAYDPARLAAPTLIVHAEWDADCPSDMSHALFPLLTGAPWKRFVEIGEGTHAVMMEKNRLQLFRAVSGFLAELAPGSTSSAWSTTSLR